MIGDGSNLFIIKDFHYLMIIDLLSLHSMKVVIISTTTSINTSINIYLTTKPTTTQPPPNKPSLVLSKTGLHINHDLVYFIEMIFASYHHSFK